MILWARRGPIKYDHSGVRRRGLSVVQYELGPRPRCRPNPGSRYRTNQARPLRDILATDGRPRLVVGGTVFCVRMNGERASVDLACHPACTHKASSQFGPGARGEIKSIQIIQISVFAPSAFHGRSTFSYLSPCGWKGGISQCPAWASGALQPRQWAAL
jgi:hypothetical protein